MVFSSLFPDSSSASRFTAGAFEIVILGQSGGAPGTLGSFINPHTPGTHIPPVTGRNAQRVGQGPARWVIQLQVCLQPSSRSRWTETANGAPLGG